MNPNIMWRIKKKHRDEEEMVMISLNVNSRNLYIGEKREVRTMKHELITYGGERRTLTKLVKQWRRRIKEWGKEKQAQ